MKFSAKLAVGIAAVGVLALVVACGGSDSKDEATATPRAAATQQSETTAVAETTTVTIGKSFWHAGWKVTLGEATITSGARGSISIASTFENLGDATGTFDSGLVLTADGENYESSDFDTKLPNVPGKLKGSGTIVFDVKDGFDIDDAVLLVGNPANNQAKLPLGSGGGAAVTLEPRAIPVTGVVTAGSVTLNVTGAELRADFPDVYRQVEKGKLALTVSFSASVAAGIPIGEGVLQSENVALKLPDGTAVAVISDGRSGVNELLQGKEGTTISGLSVRFEINDPPPGAYAFVLKGKYSADRSTVEGELPFTIAAASGGTASTPNAGPSAGVTGTAGAAPTSGVSTPVPVTVVP